MTAPLVRAGVNLRPLAGRLRRAHFMGLVNGPLLDLSFTAGVYQKSGASYALANLPGWSYSGAVSGTGATVRYAPTSSGSLTSFANGVPRITDLGFLVEESRTNLLLQSQNLADNAAWAKGAASIGADTATAPDGTVTADKLAEDGTTGTHTATSANLTTTASTYTTSVYLKAAERSWALLYSSSTGSSGVWVNLSTGAIGTKQANVVSASMTAGPNGWWRLQVTFPWAASATSGVVISPATADNVSSYTGTVGSGVYVWGAQLEQGSFVTSYIPTTTGAVTRAADVATIGGLSLTAATLVAIATPRATDATFRRVVSLNDGTTTNEADISISSGNARGLLVAASVTQASFNIAAWTGTQKAALSYAAGAQAMSFAASVPTTATGASTITATTLGIGHAAGAGQFCGYIQRVQVLTPVAPNAQLAGLP